MGKSRFGGQNQKLIGDILSSLLDVPQTSQGMGRSGVRAGDKLADELVIRLRTESDLASWKSQAANRSSFSAMGVKHQFGMDP